MWGKKVKASHKSWNKNTSQDYVTKTWCKNTSQYVMYFYLTRLVWGIFASRLMRCIFTSRLVRCIFTSRLVWGIFTSHDSSEVFLPHALSEIFYFTNWVRYVLPHDLHEIFLPHDFLYFDPTIYVPCGKNMMRLQYLTSWDSQLSVAIFTAPRNLLGA